MTVLLRYLLGMVGMDRTARTHFAGSESEARWIFMIKKKGTQSPENIQLNGNFRPVRNQHRSKWQERLIIYGHVHLCCINQQQRWLW